MKFFGKQSGEKTIIYERNKMLAWLQSLDGKEITIDITKTKIKRTIDQNSGVHKLLDWFASELTNLTGEEYTMQRVKSMMGAKFLVTSIYDKEGIYRGEGIKSTADLSLSEMSEFIEKIYSYAADQFQIELPELIRVE